MSYIKRILVIAYGILSDPQNTLTQLRSEKTSSALTFILVIGAVTAFLTPLQVLAGYEDVNGLHAGGQAEYLARDVSIRFGLGLEFRPFLIEVFYIVILLISTAYLHIIFKVVGGKGSVNDTLRMIAYGDAPALLFGWVPYFATVAAVWAAVIQLFIGPMVYHKLSWAKACIVFSLLLGAGIIEIALSEI